MQLRWFLIFFISTKFCVTVLRAEYVYKFTKIDCSVDPKYIVNVSCRLKPVNWHKTYFSMDADIVKPLRNFSLHLQVFLKDYANIYHPFVVNVTSNVCDILSKKNFPSWTTFAISLLRRFSNVNHSCPYTGHLQVKNAYPYVEFMPVLMPPGTYKVNLRYLEGIALELICTASFEVVVAERRVEQRLKKDRKT